MKTKMFATVLAMLMLLSAVVISPVSAADEAGGVVVKGAVVVAPYGATEAEVTVSVTGIPAEGLSTVLFNTRVDGAAVVTSAEAVEGLTGYAEAGPTDKAAANGVNFMWASTDGLKEDTELVKFKVSIPADAACGTVYEVVVTPSDDADDFLAGDGATAIAVSAENGKVMVGHSLTHVEAVAPTPEVAGNIEYWTCDKCGKFFSDEAGMTEIKEEDTKVEYTEPDFTPGDVNGDGSINARDITAIMKFMLGNKPANFNEQAADFNSDGSINARDITAIMRHILNNNNK